VIGIRLNDVAAEVHVTVVYGRPVLDVAEQVRAAVSPLVTVPVAVSVEDVVPAVLVGGLS
ncbi:MAG: hypothetical protein ACRCZP_19570, partial [Phycicoccus sp.]